MRRSLFTLVGALVAACVVMAIIGGTHAVALTSAILLPVGLVALLLAHAADARRLRMSTLNHRFQLGIGLALGQLLAALLIGAAVMFVSPHDAWMTVGILIFAAVIAARAAQILLDDVVADVDSVAHGLHSVGQGEREVHVQARSGTELSDLADSANAMIETLRLEERSRDEADAARRQVIAAVSHDLRTPLASLQLLAQALDDDLVDPATARRYVKSMGANVRALGSLVDDLFEFSRLNAGDFAWTTEAVPLAGIVAEMVEAIRLEAQTRRVAVHAEIASDLHPARANPEQLGRVLANLLTNAIRHTPPDGSVLVRAHQRDDAAEIEVSDTGEGIAAVDQPRIFEPFYRGGNQAARTSSGSGLGLTIARTIVEAHGGRIWLAEARTGTRICFTLPLAS
ncbi:MAG TPA: HAMP domain-containing sensor histidine kinase [Solirubrobacteraceae bacterium]